LNHEDSDSTLPAKIRFRSSVRAANRRRTRVHLVKGQPKPLGERARHGGLARAGASGHQDPLHAGG
jgi:hypothetical protein